jgi:hypothetical protein
MNHTLVSFGWYPHGARHFCASQTRAWNKGDDPTKGPPREVEFPGDKFDGIAFGFFDAPDKEFLLVSVRTRVPRGGAKTIVLVQPVLFVPGRHGVKGPSASFPKLSDDAAAAILVDMIVANPAFRDVLGGLLRGL